MLPRTLGTKNHWYRDRKTSSGKQDVWCQWVFARVCMWSWKMTMYTDKCRKQDVEEKGQALSAQKAWRCCEKPDFGFWFSGCCWEENLNNTFFLFLELELGGAVQSDFKEHGSGFNCPGSRWHPGLCPPGRPHQWDSLPGQPTETLSREPHLCESPKFQTLPFVLLM